MADFAIELLACGESEDPEVLTHMLVISGFTKLLFRGYGTLLLKAGPRVLTGGGKGTPTLSDVRKWISALRADSGWIWD